MVRGLPVTVYMIMLRCSIQLAQYSNFVDKMAAKSIKISFLMV